jgi:hypothetical protein
MNGRQRAAHPWRVKVTGPLSGYADGFRQHLAERAYHPQVIGRQALLPPDQALAANQNIQDKVLAYRAWGVPGTLDQLRVLAFLDSINGTDAPPGQRHRHRAR